MARKTLTVPKLPPEMQAGADLAKSLLEPLPEETGVDDFDPDYTADEAPTETLPVRLELPLGPTKGERGEFLPATYKTASGSIRSDR